jgi:hypothetical protein
MKNEQRSMFRVTRALLGLPCWGVKRGYGSFLTLQFGEPQLLVREPMAAKSGSAKVRRSLARRHVVVHGAWRLWIYCCDWRVESAGKTVGDASTRRRIDAAARALDGQKLIGITLGPRGARTKFIFDLGAVLETRPYDRTSEQWMLYTPTGHVVTFRADRRYAIAKGNRPESEHSWRSA